MRAYIFDEGSDPDQRLPHDSGREVSAEELNRIGVLTYTGVDLPRVNEIAIERSYKNRYACSTRGQ
jgi:1,2-dihydroxy-3-keto-5-methylthiopentene dioxygenase